MTAKFKGAYIDAPLLLGLVVLVAVAGCWSMQEIVMGNDTGADTDTDADTDSDGDVDTDTDSDTDTGPNECTQDLGEYTGNFEINTQSDVATLAGYTSLSGNLTIDCPLCADLSELICLTSVGGNLSIINNDALTNLDGLSAITFVGGDLYICENAALTNLDGLSAITSVGEYLGIHGNIPLPDCEVCDLLDQLTNVPTEIEVHDNLDDACTPVPAGCP